MKGEKAALLAAYDCYAVEKTRDRAAYVLFNEVHRRLGCRAERAANDGVGPNRSGRCGHDATRRPVDAMYGEAWDG